MRLYHFTAISHMHSILSIGLTKGEMPISSTRTINAVNLTTDKTGIGHGLCKAKFVTPAFLNRRGERLGPQRQVPMFPNKHKVRITLDLDRAQVTRWMRWAKSNVGPEAMKALISNGGGTCKAKTWYFSHAPILPAEFQNVEVRQDGQWVDIFAYKGPWKETITDKMLMDGYAHWGRRLLSGLPSEYATRLEDLIEHQVYLDELETDALSEASWPESARLGGDHTRITLMEKLTSHVANETHQDVEYPAIRPYGDESLSAMSATFSKYGCRAS